MSLPLSFFYSVMSAARDEYDALFNKQDRLARHPHDNSRSASPSTDRVDNTRDNTADHAADDADDHPYRSSITQGNRKHSPAGEDDDEDDSTNNNTSNMRSRYFLPSLAFDANTGPKGVIADAHNFEKAKKSQRFSFFRSKDAATVAIPPAYPVPGSRSGNSSDEEEDDFMSRWRQNRLRELQQSERPLRSRTASPSKRIYGRLDSVDPDGFLDAIEKVRADTVVVVYIYDDNVSLDASTYTFRNDGTANITFSLPQAKPSRTTFEPSHENTPRPTSSSSTTRTPRWKVRVFRHSSPTEAARSSPTWCP